MQSPAELLTIRRIRGNAAMKLCPKCNKHFEIGAMEADHITPWSKAGRTNADNCQLLCLEDNRRKGAI